MADIEQIQTEEMTTTEQQPAEDATDQQKEEQATTEQATTEQVSTEQATTEQATTEQVSTEQATTEQASTEQSTITETEETEETKAEEPEEESEEEGEYVCPEEFDEREEMCKMFVGGLDKETTDEEFKELFTSFGGIKDFIIIRKENNKSDRLFGFITFEKCDDLEACLLARPHTYKEKELDVKRAVPKASSEANGTYPFEKAACC